MGGQSCGRLGGTGLGASSDGCPPLQAIHMETDPQTISAYLVYLSQHTPVEEQGPHSDLALVRGMGPQCCIPGSRLPCPAACLP